MAADGAIDQVPRNSGPPPIVAGRISIAICTRNRAAQLRRLFETLARYLTASSPDWQVVLVLNDCSDDSPAIALHFALRLPLVVVTEPRRGLSHARNRAIDAASGEFMLWLDDDVYVPGGCLTAYRKATARWPAADILAGPIRPGFEGQPPDWLARALPLLGTAYAATAEHADGAVVTSDSLPYGANFAVRTRVQRQHRYDPDLGRGPADWLRGGEETDVLNRILADGGSGHWVRDVAVDHVIPVERQTIEYLRRYFEGDGRTAGLIDRRSRRRSWVAAPFDTLALAAAMARFAYARRFQTPEQWAARLVKTAIRQGRWKANYFRGP